MTTKLVSTTIISLILVNLLASCSYVSVPVEVTRPAAINLSGYKDLSVGPFFGKRVDPEDTFDLLVIAIQALGTAANTGQAFASNWQGRPEDGSDVAVYIYRALSEANRFSLLDFSAVPKARELNEAVLLVSGQVTRNEVERNVERKVTKDGSGNVNTVYTLTTGIDYEVSLKLIDVSNGEIFLVEQYPCSYSDVATQEGYEPEGLSQRRIDDYFVQCKNEVAYEFAKSVAPYTEIVNVHFAKIGESRETEMGIELARAGNWSAALKSFLAVPDTQEMAEPEVQSRAWWNLAMIYEYSYDFPNAMKMIEKAHSLYPDSRYLTELTKIRRLEEDQRKLNDQKYKGPAKNM